MPQRHATTRRRGCPSRLGARVISPGPRGTRGHGAGRTFFGQKKIKPTTLHSRHHHPAHARAPPTLPQAPTNKPHPQSPAHARAHTQAPRAPNARGRAHTRTRAQKAKKNSAIGTRTRVSWVKAKYDNSRVFSYRQKHTYTIAEQLSIGKNAALSCLRLVKRAAD